VVKTLPTAHLCRAPPSAKSSGIAGWPFDVVYVTDVIVQVLSSYELGKILFHVFVLCW
jgi:hypothetical protein